MNWWPRGRQAEESGAGLPPSPVVNELDDGPQGVPGCFGCLPPSSKHHEDAHKVRGFPAFFGHIRVQMECGPDREYTAETEDREEEATTGLSTVGRDSDGQERTGKSLSLTSELIGALNWGGRTFHIETNPSCVAKLQGLPLPRDEQQSRRRSLLSALPMIGQR